MFNLPEELWSPGRFSGLPHILFFPLPLPGLPGTGDLGLAGEWAG